jgi:hypothetical protein
MIRFTEKIVVGHKTGTLSRIQAVLNVDTETVSQFIRGAVNMALEYRENKQAPKTVSKPITKSSIPYTGQLGSDESFDAFIAQQNAERAKKKPAPTPPPLQKVEEDYEANCEGEDENEAVARFGDPMSGLPKS